MRILYTDEIDPATLSASDKLYFYNGMDCLICREVFDQIHPLLDETTSVTYNFMRALQAPVLEMQLRGVLVDKAEKARKQRELRAQLKRLESILDTYVQALWGQPLNVRSPQQKYLFLYDFAKCREITKFDHAKGESRRTADREALEHLAAKYLKIRPIVLVMLKIMDVSKLLGMLKAAEDPDGFFRSSFNIAGTSTGRFSSKKNVFGRGGNFQQIPDSLRSIFTAPEGPIPERERYWIPEEVHE